MFRSIATAAFLTLTNAAAATESATHNLVQEGTDFCFTRSYSAAHLAAHPRQLVSSIRIMGRNAWRGDVVPNAELVATAVVTFRDRKAPLELYARCFEFKEKPGITQCGFVPGEFQDVLGQVINLERDGQRIRATVSSD